MGDARTDEILKIHPCSSMHAGDVLLFIQMEIAYPKQIAQIFLRRVILAAATVTLWISGVDVVVWRRFW